MKRQNLFLIVCGFLLFASTANYTLNAQSYVGNRNVSREVVKDDAVKDEAESLYQEACAFRSARQYSSALAKIWSACEKAPDNQKYEDEKNTILELIKSTPDKSADVVDSKTDRNSPNPIDVSPSQDADTLYRLACDKAYGNNVAKIDAVEAMELLRQAADKGSLEAQAELAMWYVKNRSNYDKAYVMARKTAEAGIPLGALVLGGMYKMELIKIPGDESEGERWFETAFDGFQKRAREGDALAQFYLAVYYQSIMDIDKNSEKYLEWLLKSAEQGNAYAQWRLVHCYNFGEGTGEELHKRYYWLLKAADQGLADAQCAVGSLYLGEDVYGIQITTDHNKQNNEKAIEWFKKAADQNNGCALYELGKCYASGIGVEQDDHRALNYYEKAAEVNDIDALYKLVGLYRQGPHSYEKREKSDRI